MPFSTSEGGVYICMCKSLLCIRVGKQAITETRVSGSVIAVPVILGECQEKNFRTVLGRTDAVVNLFVPVVNPELRRRTMAIFFRARIRGAEGVRYLSIHHFRFPQRFPHQ
jgi:hypothetical protein